jgi:hypothetical protein
MEDLENINFKTVFLLILKIHKNQNLYQHHVDTNFVFLINAFNDWIDNPKLLKIL